jgi:hypothetical protein
MPKRQQKPLTPEILVWTMAERRKGHGMKDLARALRVDEQRLREAVRAAYPQEYRALSETHSRHRPHPLVVLKTGPHAPPRAKRSKSKGFVDQHYLRRRRAEAEKHAAIFGRPQLTRRFDEFTAEELAGLRAKIATWRARGIGHEGPWSLTSITQW